MQLMKASWIEVEKYLQTSKAIVIPIGSVEQHGPNGLLGTDALCPQIIAHRAAEQADILVGPTFNVGCAQHHLGFAGTITLRPSTMIAAIQDWTASLRRHGFERIYWLNGHGGNIPTINAAFSEVYAELSFANTPPVPALQLKLQNWWQLAGVSELCNEIYPVGHGMHATASEVAVTYAGYPDAQKQVEMTPKIAPLGEISHAYAYRQSFPDGRIGSDPSQACVEDGQRIIEFAAKALIEEFSSFSAR